MKKILTYILIIFSGTAVFAQNKSVKKNILFIMVDDLGYADFTAFSSHDASVVSPNIQALAKRGTSFTQAYTTAPVCSPSRVGLLTGKNQFRWDKPASWGPGLPDNVKSMAEYLQEAGYTTAKIGKSDLGTNFHKNNVREYPTKHGFEEFLGFNAHAHDYWLSSQSIKDRTPDPEGTSAVLGPLMYNDGYRSLDSAYLTDYFTDAAIEYLQRPKDKPFFLTVSYNAVHHLIHEVPDSYLKKFGAEPIKNYDPADMMGFMKHEKGTYSAYYDKYSRTGAIAPGDMRAYYLANLNCLDDNIGRLMETMKAQKLLENTIIVFISDNGGEPLTGANNAPLTAGKYSLWEGGIKVPMAVVWPGRTKAGSMEHKYISATDILPTLMEATDLKLKDENIDGISFFKPKKNRMLVWKWQKTFAIRHGKWKLTNAHDDHWKGEPSAQYIAPIQDDNSLKLFDLNADPGERVNLAAKYPALVVRLQQEYDKWMADNFGKY